MVVRFWGTRGSLPAPMTAARIRQKVLRAVQQAVDKDLRTADDIEEFVDKLRFSTRGTYGGNTSCVEMDAGGDEYILCDLGTGVREFGEHSLAAPQAGKKKVFNVFLSHLHWDHVMGFPLFAPAYMAGHKIVIHGCHETIEQALRAQHSAPGFPVPFEALKADIELATLKPEKTYRVANLDVRAYRQPHPGDSYAFRFEAEGKTVVYATDAEHRQDRRAEWASAVAFFRDADIVIFDTMYSHHQVETDKVGWGHSSYVIGVRLCHEAGVKHLCMYHHDPTAGDLAITGAEEQAIRYEQGHAGGPMRVTAAYDGLELTV